GERIANFPLADLERANRGWFATHQASALSQSPQAASSFLAAATGRLTKNVEPLPRTDSTQIRPPCSSTIRLAIANPSPVPLLAFVMAVSLCWNSSNIFS